MEALFSVGQMVVCVDSKDHTPHAKGLHPPLIEGKTYTNLENYVCDCGLVCIDVGIGFEGKISIWNCKCGRKKLVNKWFINQYRFVPLLDDRAMDDEIREILVGHMKVNE